MITEEFRRQLRHEAERWWSEGLIDAALYDQLSQRYRFQHLERDANHRFIAILMGLGGILLGLGAITFVAANWQDWSRGFKVLLLLSLFMGVNAAGFYLWQQPVDKGRSQRLGQGLLLLGALVLGANMALMSQMFHQSGNAYELLLLWGLGVVAMAYSLRLAALGVLALVLFGMGYCSGYVVWLTGQEATALQLVIQHMPLATSLLFVPLAYRCGSRAIFGLAAVLVAMSLTFNLQPLANWGSSAASGPVLAIAFTLPIALLWSYSDRLRCFSSSSAPQSFSLIARSLAVACLAILLYVFSFHWAWDSVNATATPSSESSDWLPLVDAIALGLLALWNWLQLRHQLRHRWWLQERSINSGAIAVAIVAIASIFISHSELRPIPELAVVAFNALLFLLAMGLIRDGLALGSRETFWSGMSLLVIGIISRMLEYDTGLLLKSIVFALCGIGVMLAGLWFERNIRPRHRSTLTQASQEELP